MVRRLLAATLVLRLHFTFAAFIFIGGITGAGSSHAATLQGTIFEATGIDGLVVGTVTYNVAFQNGAYTTVYATTPATFLGDEAGAQAAAAALATALKDLQVRYLTGLAQTGAQNALVPYSGTEASNAQCASQTDCAASAWSAVLTQSFVPTTTYGDTDFTVFTATPIPGALSLFATGLGVIGLLAWLRSHAALWVPGRGTVGRHLTETGTTIQTDFFHQILPPTALILGLVLTIVWISFLAYQIGRLFEATS
jgi:hypothetical protein